MHYSTALLLAATAGSVVAEEACSPLHFIYARASTEPNELQTKMWSAGFGAAGASILSNVTKLIPAITSYSVRYAATLPLGKSACVSEDPGVADMLKQIRTKAKACPNQKYVLGGHSQGGVVTVRTIRKIDKDILPRILAVTMVGSPNCPTEVKDVCRSFCNQGDSICSEIGPPKTSDCDTGAKGGSPEAPKMPKAASGPKSIPRPAPKGGMSEMVEEKRSVETAQEAWTSDEAMREWMQKLAGFDLNSICAGPEVPEKGYKVTQSKKGAHLAYSEDGYYVYAAACYIAKQYKAIGGA